MGDGLMPTYKKAGIFIEGGNKAIQNFTNRISGAVNHMMSGGMEGMEEGIDIVADPGLRETQVPYRLRRSC